MLNLGYVNRFGSGVNTVSTLLEENKSNPAEFLLGDYTTFKVVVQNADVIENGTDVIDKKPNVIVNIAENGTDGTNDVTNNRSGGTMRNDERNDWNDERNDAERYEDVERLVLDKMRADKRISVKQLSNMFGKSKTAMFRIIDKLKAEGKIRRVGSEKSGTWEVIE